MADLTEHQPFLQTIYEHPADDGPRLVYADWLEERGLCDRAEFIRYQIQFANGSLRHNHKRGRQGKCEACYGLKRLGKITASEQWFGNPLWGMQGLKGWGRSLNHFAPVFVRGFIQGVCTSWRRFVEVFWRKGKPRLTLKTVPLFGRAVLTSMPCNECRAELRGGSAYLRVALLVDTPQEIRYRRFRLNRPQENILAVSEFRDHTAAIADSEMIETLLQTCWPGLMFSVPEARRQIDGWGEQLIVSRLDEWQRITGPEINYDYIAVKPKLPDPARAAGLLLSGSGVVRPLGILRSAGGGEAGITPAALPSLSMTGLAIGQNFTGRIGEPTETRNSPE